MSVDLVLRPKLANLRQAMRRELMPIFQNSPQGLHIPTHAMRQAPLPLDDFVEVLVDSNHLGRALRAIIGLAGTFTSLEITNVSTIGENNFAALADVRQYRLVDPGINLAGARSFFGNSRFARENHRKIILDSRYYYLTAWAAEFQDVVLTPRECDCCFDAPIIDDLRSIFDLRRTGSMLIKHTSTWKTPGNPIDKLIDWMQRAGFETTAYLGYDALPGWLYGATFSAERSRSFSKDDFMASCCWLIPFDAQKDPWGFQPIMRDLIGSIDCDCQKTIYYVFQRTFIPSRTIMEEIAREISDWTRINFWRKNSGYEHRLESFRTSLPGLINSFYTSLE